MIDFIRSSRDECQKNERQRLKNSTDCIVYMDLLETSVNMDDDTGASMNE